MPTVAVASRPVSGTTLRYCQHRRKPYNALKNRLCNQLQNHFKPILQVPDAFYTHNLQV